MGDVVSFFHYSFLREVVIMNEPCPRPFHHRPYVLNLKENRCERCNISVRLQDHPSMQDGPQWYG